MCEYKKLRHKINHFLKLMLYTRDKKEKKYLNNNKLFLKTIFYKANFDCDTKWSWIFQKLTQGSTTVLW